MYNLSAKEYTARVIASKGSERAEAFHIFKMPTAEDWFAYYRGSTQLGLSKSRDIFETSNTTQEKDAQFWMDMIVKVKGYTVKGQDVMQLDDWKDRIPLPHKLGAIAALMIFDRVDVSEDTVTGDSFELEEGEISLQFEAVQDMKRYPLTFHFDVPSQKHYVKHSRMSSRMQFARTKQRNVSAIWVPTDIRPLVGLFDELIQKVEGYKYDTKDVMVTQKWREKISALHKAEAIRELFSSSVEEEEEEGK